MGRFTSLKAPYKQRLCKMWGEAPEDQTHFLLMCPKLREPQVVLFKSVSEKYQNFITELIAKKLSILLHPQEHVYCITMGIYTWRQKLIFNHVFLFRITLYHHTLFECVDRNPETMPGGAGGQDGVLFHHVEATCIGIACPLYTDGKELACAVCTKWT